MLEFAEALGFDDLSKAQSITIQTGGGSLPAYLVDIELEIVLDERSRFGCRVGFAHLPRNILGRDIIFSKYLLAFEEQAQVIYYRNSER